MNTQKYYAHNSNLLKENDRTFYIRENENGEAFYDSQSRSRIDFSKTNLNYNLCPHPQYSKQQLLELHKNIRGKNFPKNGVLFGQTIITLPKDFDGDSQLFFQTAYDGLKQLYKLNDVDIVSAYVHMDETSPHMHFNFIPVHRTEERVQISWEKMFPKTMYDCQHKVLESYMNEQNIGVVRLLNGQTLGFDVQNLDHNQKSILSEIYELKEKRDSVYEEISNLENRKITLQKNIDFYFDNGNESKANECVLKWEECNTKIQNLSIEKKEIGKLLDLKYAELNGNSHITASQKEIIELTSDKIILENRCYENALEIKRVNFEKKSLLEEVRKLRDDKQKELEKFSDEIEKLSSDFGISEEAAEEFLNDLHTALLNCTYAGRKIESEGMNDVERNNFIAKTLQKNMENMEKSVEKLEKNNKTLKEKIKERIQSFKDDLERSRIINNPNIVVHLNKDGKVTEQAKEYIYKELYNLMYSKNKEDGYEPVRCYYWELDKEGKEELLHKMTNNVVRNVEKKAEIEHIKFLDKIELQKFIKATKIINQHLTVAGNIASKYMAVQQQIANEYER